MKNGDLTAPRYVVEEKSVIVDMREKTAKRHLEGSGLNWNMGTGKRGREGRGQNQTKRERRTKRNQEPRDSSAKMVVP